MSTEDLIEITLTIGAITTTGYLFPHQLVTLQDKANEMNTLERRRGKKADWTPNDVVLCCVLDEAIEKLKGGTYGQ